MSSFGTEKNITQGNAWAPVIVFAYNRLSHLQECLGTLEHAEGAAYSELYIFSDGYKGDKDKDKVTAVQEYLHGYEKNSLFHSVHVTYSKSNKGLAESVIEGVGKIIGQYGCVIVVEDDLIVSPDFLKYMNLALKHYENDRRIWQIGGWSPDVAQLGDLEEDTYLWYRSNSWGWGTWADRWEMVDWGVQDYKNFRFSFPKRHKMNRGGADMSDMLDMQMQGKINSWAIRFAYTESMNDMLTVFPKKSKVVCCGRDGSGTNCHAMSDNSESDVNEWRGNQQINAGGYQWNERVLHKAIERKLYRFFSGNRRTCMKRLIRSMVNRINISK